MIKIGRWLRLVFSYGMRLSVGLFAGLLAIIPDIAHAERCKQVTDLWAWFSDHLVTSVTYVVQGPRGRIYEVGTGIKAWGAPRGTIHRGTEKIEVTAYGIGAIHVRLSDGGGPGTICVSEGNISTIDFLDIEF